MDKKKLLITLSLFPLAASCHGVLISSNDARKTLENINKTLNEKDNDYQRFTYYYDEYYGEENYSNKKVVFDKNAKYSYSYQVSYLHIVETWNYVVKTDNDTSHILRGKRIDGKVNENGFPDVEYEWFFYSDQLWNEIETSIFSEINELLFYSLERMEKMINYYDVVSSDDIMFTSFNSNSLCVEGKTNDQDFFFRVDDFLLKEMQQKINDHNYTKFTCNYERVTINYLNVPNPN